METENNEKNDIKESKQFEKNKLESKEKRDFLSQDDIGKFVDSTPSELKRQIKTSIMMSSLSGMMPSPFLKKFTKEHIDKLIDYSEKDSERGFTFSKRTQNFRLIYILLGLMVFIFLTLYLAKDNTNLFITLISHLIALLAGTAAGFGLKSQLDKKK